MLHTYELDVLHSNIASDLFLQLHLFPFMTPLTLTECVRNERNARNAI